MLLSDLRAINIFKNCEQALLEKIEKNLKIKDEKSGTTILNQGDETKNLYIIIDGTLLITQLAEDGKVVSLELLKKVRKFNSRIYTKSGFMLGLGEKDEEVLNLLMDLRKNDVDIVTIGQYLSPGPKHLPVQRFVSPSKFNFFKYFGQNELNFLQVVSSPLTRSSYHAEDIQKLMKQYPR